MKIVKILPGAAAAMCLALAPAYAAGSNGKGGGPSIHANGHAQSAPTQTTHGNAPTAPQTTHGNPHTTPSTGSAPTHGNPHGSNTPPSKGGNTKTSTPTPTTNSTTTTSTTTTSTTTTTTSLNPIAQKLTNTQLGTRLEHLLPAGTTLDTASAGFKHQGQFIAALHVSQNLGIPFANLKTAMLATTVPGATIATPSSPKTLGQAIQQLKPFANSTTEANRAEHETAEDLRTTTTTTTTTPPTKKKKNG